MFQRLFVTSMLAVLPAFVQQTPPAGRNKPDDWISAEQIRKHLDGQRAAEMGTPLANRFIVRPAPGGTADRAVTRRVPAQRCAVPLLDVTPPVEKGKIVVIEPRGSPARMPALVVPAPPCDRR